MGRIKVLIADDNQVAARSLFDKLSIFKDFQIIDIAKDGFEAIELINREKPDVVLLDIIMPKLDGIGVLEYFRMVSGGSRPVFIVFSAISQENYISKVMNLGADYYIIKPFDVTVIAERIQQLYFDTNIRQYTQGEVQESASRGLKSRHDDELKVLATKYMREYGLKAHMTGYCYIRDIVTESFDSYCRNGTLPKGIFREIAGKNNVTIQKVERAVRNCIENVPGNGEISKKPTNSQVICQLIEKIRINN